MNKKALITGITGQDGSYLAEFLLHKGYEVHGIIRRASTFNTTRIDHIYVDAHMPRARLFLHQGDVADSEQLSNIIDNIKPDEIYHLAAQSHVRISFDMAEYTGNITALGTTRILNIIKKQKSKIKFYQASSSEMFGKCPSPQNENTPFHPRSPYAVAKLYAYWMAVNYREGYNIFASNGILFNHESPRRGETFVTRKITRAVTNIAVGREKKLYLGNLKAKRDWGYAPEYCFNKDVPILTTDGWKCCDEVKKGQEIINFDPQNNRLTRDKVTKKVVLPSNGDKIVLKGRGIYLAVTPQHRIYYQKKRPTSKGGWSQWKVITAEKFYNLLVNKARRTKYDYRLPHFQNYDANDYGMVNDEQLYLIGALLAEGSLHQTSSRQNGGIEVSISQSYIANKATFNKINKVIKTLGLKHRIREMQNGCVEWTFNAGSSRKILSWFDTTNIHIMPRYFYKLSRRQSEIVFTALMDCDGAWGSMTYVSRRYLLIVDFQTIAHLAGYRTSKIKRRKSSGCYEVNVIVKRKKYAYVQDARRINDGHREVWCVQTRNGSIIVRDNDCVSISGNCEVMWRMLQKKEPGDFVIGTGRAHSVEEFVKLAFDYAGLNYKKHVRIDRRYCRPTEINDLVADSRKAKRQLGWRPKVTFEDLAKIMVDADMRSAGQKPIGEGDRILKNKFPVRWWKAD